MVIGGGVVGVRRGGSVPATWQMTKALFRPRTLSSLLFAAGRPYNGSDDGSSRSSRRIAAVTPVADGVW
jgi:hypothetical protein